MEDIAWALATDMALVSGIHEINRWAAEHEPRPPMVELFLVQKFPPFILCDLRAELCVLEQLEMMESMRIPDKR